MSFLENFTVQINFSIFKKVFKRVWLLNRTLFFGGIFNGWNSTFV